MMRRFLDLKRPSHKTAGLLLLIPLGLFIWNATRLPTSTSFSSSSTSTIATIQKRPQVLHDGALMHMIKTRFMQHQAHLHHLARARLELFKTFCLPSMIHQTTTSFVWIISVDPALDRDILSEMVQLLQPYPHFYLTLTTDNVKPGSGRHGIGEEILTGDVQVFRKNLDNMENLAVLETQLDADDALHIQFIEDLQQRANAAFFRQKNGPDWMYWCIHQDIEWHWIPRPSSGATDGVLQPSRSFVKKQKCYTPGMTLGVRNGHARRDVLDVPHSSLISELGGNKPQKCGAHHKGLDCLHFVDTLEYPALRTRTPTSASMVGVTVQAVDSFAVDKQVGKELWSKVSSSFAVKREEVRGAHQHLTDHMVQILQDAVQGQCSHGHSCRKEATEELRSFLKLYSPH
eukprot:scaffold15076_cov155-Amphora_coffeaeformis.AAC.3